MRAETIRLGSMTVGGSSAGKAKRVRTIPFVRLG